MRPVFSLFLLLLLSLVTLPAKSHAEEYVLCLQRQLNALGYDAGPEDGLWGKRTKAAALALRSENPLLKDHPNLAKANRASAIAWCREIGVARFDTQKYRPSFEDEKFRFAPEFTAVQRSVIKSSTFSAWAFLKHYLKFDLASRIDVVAGVDAGQIATDMKAISRRGSTSHYPNQRKKVGKHCDGVTTWTAIAYPDFIMICANPDMTDDADWIKEKPRLIRLFIHEFVHSFQSEHSLAKTQPDLSRRGLKTMGPGWMVEGAAMLAEFEHYSRGLREFGFSTIAQLQAPAKESKLRLGKLGKLEGREEYEVARFAVFLLAKRESVSRVMDYWRLLGQGKSPNQAFVDIFGMSLAEFEEHFQRARNEAVYAIQFIQGLN